MRTLMYSTSLVFEPSQLRYFSSIFFLSCSLQETFTCLLSTHTHPDTYSKHTYIYILTCFYHRWIVVIGLYIVYIICYPGHPHMFTYIYTILSGHPHIHTHIYTYIYIYTLNPTTLPLSHHSRNSRLLLLLLAAAAPLKRWSRCRPQQTFQFVIYIKLYIYVNIYRFII